ncbi:hypothetical protein SLA2020_243660 [Shorea laevis]
MPKPENLFTLPPDSSFKSLIVSRHFKRQRPFGNCCRRSEWRRIYLRQQIRSRREKRSRKFGDEVKRKSEGDGSGDGESGRISCD